MKESLIQEFLNNIDQKNIFQSKFLRKSALNMTSNETDKLDNLIKFYMLAGNNTIEEIADKYLSFIRYLMEDQLYFFENEKYRFSTYEEANRYYNENLIMDNYLTGLGLSTYLWSTHRRVMHFFEKYLEYIKKGNTYFEVGPGHGEYMIKAIEKTEFNKYLAVDISEDSVNSTKLYIDYFFKENPKDYEIIHKDFFEYKSDISFDAVVMGEVLEHVEKPAEFLRKIYEITSDKSFIFITTAINAPEPGHIYLFNKMSEITKMIENESFLIIESLAVNTDNIPFEKAEKRKVPIIAGFILKKN